MMSEEDKVFDPARAREMKQAASKLKKQNIQAVFGQGKGRLSAIVLFGCFVVVAVIGALRFYNRPSADVSGVRGNGAMLQVPDQGDKYVATQGEADMRARQNASQAAAAGQQGNTYLAPPILSGTDSSSPQGQQTGHSDLAPASAQAPVKPTPNAAATLPQQQPAMPVANGQPAAAPLPDAKLVARTAREQQLSAARASVAAGVQAQIYYAMGRDDAGKAARAGSYVSVQYSLPPRVKNEVRTVSSLNASAASTQTQKEVLVDGGMRFYGQLVLYTNSDDGTTQALGKIYQGKLNGATFYGTATNHGESYSFDFKSASIPGHGMVAINVIALNPDTNSPSFADDVNHHTFQKYGALFFASALSGLGKAAQIVTGSTQITGVGSTSIATTDTTPVTTAQQLKISAGEVGTDFASQIKTDNASIKTTVIVNGNHDAIFVFLSPAYEEKK